jgi:glutamate/tyrosine decarboxylase-like PLP-dependent enzyme
MKKLEEIQKELESIEVNAKKLEPPSDILEGWTENTFSYAKEFLGHLSDSPVFATKDDSAAFFSSETLAEQGTPIIELIRQLKKNVIDPGLNPASGGHLGYIPGGGLYPAALGDYLAAVTNKYAGIFFAGSGAVRLENFLLRWMAGLFAYPESAAGHLSSGGSIANLTAIVTARDAKNVSSRNIAQSAIYHTNQVHHCIDKAIRIAGLAEAQRRIIRMDSHFRMDSDHLRACIEKDLSRGIQPFLIVSSVGSTDTGAIDPLKKIAKIARDSGAWFHVDAAYGGFFALLDEFKPAFAGIEHSDSIVVDPHKGLFLPYGVGAVIVRDGAALHRSHQYQANYMQDALENNDGWSPAELSPELTKHFRGLRMWLPLKLFGLGPFRASLREKILLTRYFYETVRTWPDFETGPYPDLSVAIYRYRSGSDDNAKNLKLAERIRNSGKVFISTTRIDDTVWLRLAVLSFRTHRETIDTLLEELRREVQFI